MSEIRFYTLKDLVSLPGPTWLVDGLIVEGGVFMVVADPKTGKSLLTLDLALRVARGTPFLGRATTKRLVVILAAEDGPTRVGSRFRDFFKVGPNPQEEIVGIFDASHLNTLLDQIAAEKEPVLLIVDPLVEVFSHLGVDDENAAAQIARAFKRIRTVCQDTKSTVIVVHHLTKGNDPTRKKPRGSTAITGAVDGWLEMARRSARGGKATVTCRPTVRDTAVDSFDIHLVETPLGAFFEVTGDPQASSKNEADSPRNTHDLAVEKVLEALKSGPLSSKDVKDRTGLRKVVVSDVTKDLITRGVIAREGESPKGKLYLRSSKISPPPAAVDSVGSGPSPTGDWTDEPTHATAPLDHGSRSENAEASRPRTQTSRASRKRSVRGAASSDHPTSPATDAS